MKQKNVIIVTGCSGSGKSTALSTFEDAGFHCIDNMPIQMVAGYLTSIKDAPQTVAGWVFGMDLRDKRFLTGYSDLCRQLKESGFQINTLFLDTDEQVLIQRFSQTRRRHPLGEGGSLVAAIRKEKKLLGPVRNQADHLIETTQYSVHELKFAIHNIARQYTATSGMSINVVSFGFKRGTPPNADMIVDVRFLSNPYFIPELKDLSGESDAIRTFVLDDPETGKFLEKYLDLLDYLVPRFNKEGKAYLTIAIGCTGGMHRSVVIAQKVYEHIQRHNHPVRLIHRDIRT
ncbi:MAG: RNase adapter RapZ [Desulfobacteraceae bacterium]